MNTSFKNLISWIKSNKLTTALLIVVAYLLFKGNLNIMPQMYSARSYSGSGFGGALSMDAMVEKAMPSSESTMMYGGDMAAPTPAITDRKVITETYLSLLVKDVEKSISELKQKATQLGGYVVNTNIYKPEYGANGQVTLRVPTNKLDEVLNFLRGLSVKVVSENTNGSDITDQYEDIATKLKQLESTKARFEQIMAQAQDVTEILKVQREILNLQSQIDSLKGRQAYLDGVSETTLISVNLSTDELGLPYAPEQSWRPEAIFKQAVRSLVFFLQDVGSALIWAAVYAPVVLIGLIVVILIKKALTKKKA